MIIDLAEYRQAKQDSKSRHPAYIAKQNRIRKALELREASNEQPTALEFLALEEGIRLARATRQPT